MKELPTGTTRGFCLSLLPLVHSYTISLSPRILNHNVTPPPPIQPASQPASVMKRLEGAALNPKP
jgi:hypothetical protein